MFYDLIIIGAGPAGLTASIYASRYRIKHFVIGNQLGGAMSWAFSIENYPGFKKISGAELTERMVDQVKFLGGEIINESVSQLTSLRVNELRVFKIVAESGREYQAKTLIIATGTQRRELGVPGEKEYLGKGVSYCATCDAAFFKDKTVVVIGGSNAAAAAAAHLAEFCQQVYLIYRKKPLRADPIWRERVEKNPKVKIIYETNITEVLGDGQRVVGAKLDQPYQGEDRLVVEGVFIEIGGVPVAELVKPLGVELDEKGFIRVNSDMSTNVSGVFAAGDIANAAGEFQQIITAASEGAIAATSVYKFISRFRIPRLSKGGDE